MYKKKFLKKFDVAVIWSTHNIICLKTQYRDLNRHWNNNKKGMVTMTTINASNTQALWKRNNEKFNFGSFEPSAFFTVQPVFTVNFL